MRFRRPDPLLRFLLPGIFWAASAGAAWGRDKLFVFYPSLARPPAIQEALARRCPDLDVTVFGRYADFRALVEKDRPQAILAQTAVLRQFRDYRIALQGTRGGATAEPYVLLSLDRPMDPLHLEGAAVGVVGLLDRKEMAVFVTEMIGNKPRVDRVTKVEDLLPLLTFRSVSAVLVSEEIMREFQKKSQATLVGTPLEKGKVSLVALGVRAGADAAAIIAALRNLEAGDTGLLGVDSWK